MKFKTKFITLIVAFLAAISFALPSQVNAALNGIDVSSNNYGIDVSRVPADFAIVKATEGTGYVNPQFQTNAQQTLSSGKKLGIYHFLNAGDPIPQAEAFVKQVRPYIGKAVLVLDFEDTNYSKVQNANGVVNAKRWLDYVYQQTGVRPWIYMSLSAENGLSWPANVIANYGIWIAQYNSYNPVYGYQPRDLFGSIKQWPSMTAFQYSSMGYLSGWGQNLDLSVFYGDRNTWDKYAAANGSTAPVTPVPSQPAESNVVSDTDYAQTGVFKPSATVNIRTGAGTGYASVGSYAPGESVIYDHVYIRGTYVWARYLSYSGRYHYVALGVNGGESYGSRSSGYTSPVSHTYYTVRYGDSFWSIASKYGTSMYTLAANNGKSIYSLIYPGESLYIR
ncbi:GH25 family lysozyme [Lacticaseibacillus paracasei]|uniref:GH25 family lysozyme n=1 Tax=Lacticaseibacillus paracasei TaxID=1597 RepID=UPI002FF48027